MRRKIFLTKDAHIVTHKASTNCFSECTEASESCRLLISVALINVLSEPSEVCWIEKAFYRISSLPKKLALLLAE